MIYEDGVYYDMPEDVYHAINDRLSSHQLGELARSPAHLQEYLQTPREPKDFQEIGTAIHAGILEPVKFEKIYVVGPEGDRRKKEIKEAYEKLVSEHPGAVIVKQAFLDSVNRCVEAVFLHEAASEVFKAGKPEMTILWTDKETGAKCKARLDWYDEARGLIADIKSTKDDARPEVFHRAALLNYKYYRQMAFYKMAVEAAGLPFKEVNLIPIEKTPPFGLMVFELIPMDLQKGEAEARPLMALYAACVKSGVWPMYTEKKQKISLPHYAYNN